MRNLIATFIAHKDLYLMSVSIGSIISFIVELFTKSTPSYFLGISVSLWSIALIINIIDINTGIKADTKRKADIGEKFVFESGKGWRAFEKVFIFTMIIWFIYSLEKEVIRLHFSSLLSTSLLYIKFILLVYVVLIEIQSIGENQETVAAKKSKLFVMLDKAIEIVNEGLLKRLRTLIVGQ